VQSLQEPIGFAPNSIHERLVLHWILARGLKFSPQALDEDQTVAAVIRCRPVNQVPHCPPGWRMGLSGLDLHSDWWRLIRNGFGRLAPQPTLTIAFTKPYRPYFSRALDKNGEAACQ